MSEIIRVRCGGCDVKIKAPLKYQGRRVNCPQCGQEVQIPVLDVAQPSASALGGAASASKAMAPVLLSPSETSGSQPRAVKPAPARDEPTFLDDSAFLEPKRPAKKPPADDFASVDFAEYEDYGAVEDYGAPPPRRQNGAARRPARRKKPAAAKSSGDSVVDPSIVGGLVMMVGSVIWFVVGWNFGVIFIYPPILFVIGIVAFVKGLLD